MGALATRSSHYTTEEIEAGLLELACWHGNVKQAARCLNERGLEIPRTTLQGWKKSHAERYEAIQAEVVPRVRDRLAQQYEAIAQRSAELALEGLDQFGEQMTELPIKELAGAIRNISTSGAIGVDKASLLRGLPTEIRQTDSAEEVLKRLAQKHPQMFVDVTAEEIPEVDAVEESPAEGAGRQLSRQSSATNAPGE